jgi:LmbE family N-acetylglucosaminyl deacetylase
VNCNLFIPDGLPREAALSRTTHLAIGAHADDLEIMAYHGIASCYDSRDQWFGGIVVTNGAGASRSGDYATYSDAQMIQIRQEEQRQAALLGRYSFMAQLGLNSEEVRSQSALSGSEVSRELEDLLKICQSDVVYLHNPADKHPTHIATLKASVEALRSLPLEQRPKKLYGCEVWRDLDWLPDSSKIDLDCSAFPDLSLELIQVFRSQIQGGKRYDLAALGRRHANATFSNPRHGDKMDCVTWAMDLSPLLQDDQLSLEAFLKPLLETFQSEVLDGLK